MQTISINLSKSPHFIPTSCHGRTFSEILRVKFAAQFKNWIMASQLANG